MKTVDFKLSWHEVGTLLRFYDEIIADCKGNTDVEKKLRTFYGNRKRKLEKLKKERWPEFCED